MPQFSMTPFGGYFFVGIGRRKAASAASFWATRGFPQDRRLARLGLGARREALYWAAHLRAGVALFRSAARRVTADEAWLKKGLPCS